MLLNKYKNIPSLNRKNAVSNTVTYDESDFNPESKYMDLLNSLGVDDDRLNSKFRYLLRDQLFPDPSQPRKLFDEEVLMDLADSIRVAGGIIQPLAVKKMKDGRYMIIAGERRWRAAGIIDLQDIPCIVYSDIDQKTIRMMSLIENIQREELTPLEFARGLESLINDHSLTHKQLANAIGKSRSTVSNALRLLDLDKPVQNALQVGQIESGHARALAVLNHEDQARILNRAITGKWSVRQVEVAVRRIKEGRVGTRTELKKTYENYFGYTATKFGHVLGYKPNLQMLPSGKITITVNTLDDLVILTDSIIKDN